MKFYISFIISFEFNFWLWTILFIVAFIWIFKSCLSLSSNFIRLKIKIFLVLIGQLIGNFLIGFFVLKRGNYEILFSFVFVLKVQTF